MLASHVPTAIDCFAGAGGLSLGLSEAGWDVRFAFDADEKAVETYKSTLGDHCVVARVEDLSSKQIAARSGLRAGECDLIVGGPPCQGFSVQRRGDAEDSRNELIFEFLRIVKELRPHLFVMENVSAIKGPRGRDLLERFQREAQGAYHLHIAVLDAAGFGVPQRRRRALVVGERRDRPSFFRWPTPTHGPSTWATVRSAIGDLGPPGDPNAPPHHVPDRISDLNRERIGHVPQGGGRADIPPHLRLKCHSVSVAVSGHRQVYGRLSWDEPAATITTKCNSFTRGMFAHPGEDRNITMREAARLQSFPDTFVFSGSKVDIAHQVGNAVPPIFAKVIGESLMATLTARRAALEDGAAVAI